MLHKSIVVLVALLSFATAVDVARGFSPNDAGSGRDAGNTRYQALRLADYGSYAGDLMNGADDDWYVVYDERGQPTCVSTSVTPEGALESTLRVRAGDDQTRTVTTTAAGGATTRMGLAASRLDLSRVGFENGPSALDHYVFGWSAMDVPPTSAGDAYANIDAGSTIATALPANDACVGGNLVSTLGIPDVDVFSIYVPGGNTIYYSLATTAGAVQLKLLDATGQVVGPTIAAGDVAGFYVPSGGTYYMSASSPTGNANIGYLIGLISGPDPPGSPCRPYCLVAH